MNQIVGVNLSQSVKSKSLGYLPTGGVVNQLARSMGCIKSKTVLSERQLFTAGCKLIKFVALVRMTAQSPNCMMLRYVRMAAYFLPSSIARSLQALIAFEITSPKPLSCIETMAAWVVPFGEVTRARRSSGASPRAAMVAAPSAV